MREDFPRRCVFIGVESEMGEVETPEGGTAIPVGLVKQERKACR